MSGPAGTWCSTPCRTERSRPGPDQRIRVLLVDVDTSASVTGTVVAAARRVVAPTTEVVGVTPRFGPEAVEGPAEGYLAAVAVAGGSGSTAGA